MADMTFDAVICGGGNKGLMLAMYLTRYAGMSVGIFERRHEIGLSGQHACQYHAPLVLRSPMARFSGVLGLRRAVRSISSQ